MLKYCYAGRCHAGCYNVNCRYAELCHGVTMLSIVRQSAITIGNIMQSLALMLHYTECHYAENNHAECHYS